MKSIVLDSSVIIKWFKTKNEEKIDKARSYFLAFKKKQVEVLILHLTFFELLNISAYEKTIPANEWSNIIKVLFNLPFKVIALTPNLAENIYQLSKNFAISAYDASYIALAQSLKADFITADKKLVKKVSLSFVKAL